MRARSLAVLFVTISAWLALAPPAVAAEPDTSQHFPPDYVQAVSKAISSELRYPDDARKAGEEGTALVRVDVERDGTIQSVGIKKSSGHPRLDAEALGLFGRLGHLPPVPAEVSPKEHEFTFRLPITFSMKNASEPTLTDGQPVPDIAAAMYTGPAAASAPSPWLEARTKRYAALLSSTQCDTLVVPAQVESAGFDRPTRLILSADVAQALSAPGRCVADTALADLALGEGRRSRQTADVENLARAIKASTVVFLYAGQISPLHMRVTLQVAHPDPAGTGKLKTEAAHSIDNIAFDLEHPPILAFHEHLPQILASVGLGVAPRQGESAGKLPKDLPLAPELFVKPTAASPLADAANLAFLGVLAPNFESHTSERLFAKAWSRLQDAAADDAGAHYLRVRLLYYLRERPAALALLKDDHSARADALRSVLNGNLPALRLAAAAANNPWDRFFLGVDLADLEQRYGRNAKASGDRVFAQFKGSPWLDFVVARLGDDDDWKRADTLPFKALLDKLYPIPGFTAPDAAIGSVLVSGQGNLDYELFALRHVHRLLEEQPERFCCRSASASPSSIDLLDMIDARVEESLVRHAEYEYSPQGHLDLALAILSAYDSELAGNPKAEILRARTYWKQIEQGQLQDRTARLAHMHAAAHLASVTEQAQSLITEATMFYINQAPRDASLEPMWMLQFDFPVRDYWDGYLNQEKARLPFSSHNPEPLTELLEQGEDTQQDYRKELDSRFVGSKETTKLRLTLMDSSQKTPAYLRGEIARDPDNWELREELAKQLVEKREFNQVGEVILRHPDFLETHPDNTVGLSNHAFAWGDELFWHGGFAAAKPLLKRAADYDDGSSASITANARLALADGDYGTAAKYLLADGAHYNEMRRYDDFLRLAFASGRDRESWAAFDQLQAHFRSNDIWYAAMVGNRKAALSDADLRKWLKSRATAAQVSGSHEEIVRYAFMEQLTDREPDNDFANFMRDFSGPAEVEWVDGKLYSTTSEFVTKHSIGPSRYKGAPHPIFDDTTVVPNRYALMAEAFAAFRKGDFSGACAAFDRLSWYYDIESDELEFVLPYFAMAASRTGDPLSLERYLDSLSPDDEHYGVRLARAIFKASAGHADDSVQWVERAAARWDTGYRKNDLKSSYVFMDITVQLFDLTGDTRFRDAALQLARMLRTIEPTDAYAAALIGWLGNDDQERIESLAVAIYLDPRSVWASKAPEALRAKAQDWLKDNHPFEFKLKADNT